MTASSSGRRSVAAHVYRRNGAYMIGLYEPLAVQGNAEADDLFDCASSLAGAKRASVAGAREIGWTGSPRWSGAGAPLWTLTLVEEDS